MDKDHHIFSRECQESMASVREEGEIRSALNRMEVEAPDAELAWKELSGKLQLEEDKPVPDSCAFSHQGAARPFLFSMSTLLKAVISAAAIVLLVFLFAKYGGDQDSSLSSSQPVVAEKSSGAGAVHSSPHSSAADLTSQENTQSVRTAQPAAQPQMLAAETGRGTSRKIVLSDGTRVWLNAESTLLYPERFAGKERRVHLTGEAYFEVKHRAECPFVVETASLVATDLGTAFDVNAYAGRSPWLILVSGKVSVQKKGDEAPAILMHPDEMLTLSAGRMKVVSVDAYPLVQWKNGLFYFHHVSLLDVMKEIGRWYGINVVFENKTCLNTQIHFVAERSLPVSEITKRLNEIEGVNIILQDKELTIK